MPPTLRHWLAPAFAIVLLLLLPGSGLAATANVVQLDTGACGHDAQLGSNKTASSTATPWFYLTGDGGASSYQAWIDGTSIGTFAGNPFAVVCISTPSALTDGPHTLTLQELAPNPSNSIAPYVFTVDTVPPAVPSTPVLDQYSDSGVAGDNITLYNSPVLNGTSDPNVPIRVYDGSVLVGSALSDSTGHWQATTSRLSNGTHSLSALAIDEAGNQSALSGALALTIDATAPTVGVTSPASGATVAGTTTVAANAADGVGVWKVAFQVDGTTVATDTASPYSYGWNSSSVGNGSHTLTAVATDVAGNTSSSSVTVTVANGTATAPGAPSLTSAAAGNASIALAWSAPSSNGGSAITGYRVYRSTSAGNETLLTTLGNVNAWTDSGLSNGATYYYKVSALNSVGESVASNEMSATPSQPATAPSAPTLNSATAGNATVALAWSAPTSNGGSAITGYRVYRGTSAGNETLLTTLGNVTAWTDSGLTNGATYYYKVSALNSVGESVGSNEMSATPSQPATAPSAPTLNSATAANTTVTLAWGAPSNNGGSAVTGYRVYRGTSSGGETLVTTLGNITSWTDTGLGNGTTYYYKVSAVNSVGESVASNEMSATPSQPATVPSAPSLTSATGGNATAVLSWSAPSNNGGSAVTGYRIYRSTSSGTESLLTTLGNVTSWTDTGVANGTTYYYKVSALNSVGESAASNELSATPTAPLTAPGAPTLNSASAGNATVSLAWSAPSNNGGSAITGYRVYRGTSSGGESLLTTLGNVTGWTDTGLANGTTYYYRVSAVNSVGESVASGELSATPIQPASVPGAPALNAATAGNATVGLAWSAPASNGGAAVSGYRVYRGTSSGGETLLTTLGNVTSWTDTSLTNGTTYYYEVTAVNSVGESARSNELSAKPVTAPGAPALNSATAGNATVAVAWSAPSNNGGSSVTGYRVYRSTSSGAESLLTTLGNVTSWTDTGLTNGTTYYYKVTAVNSAGESVTSNERSATPASTTVPGAPALVGLSSGRHGVSLTWNAPASNGGSVITGYRVYRGMASGGETLVATLGNVTGWVDRTQQGGTVYYEITAVNAVGESARSNELSTGKVHK
ncbi:MAG TPA: fibronectin type III domain-containing protein [Gaiellaceae bacterium]|nr:fibronectin type III domain-containing protein [Gaiellaceae bacterium]